MVRHPRSTRPDATDRPAVVVAGLLLAAGAGRRMGQPKALVKIDGETLAARGVRLLADGGCRPIVVVGGAAADQVAATIQPSESCTLSDLSGQLVCFGSDGPMDVLLARAEDWTEGIGASLRTGLATLAEAVEAVEAVVVTLVDQPGLTSAAVRRLVLAATPGGGHEHRLALTATYHGQPGHPVLLRRPAWAAVAALARGDVGARAWLRAHPGEVGQIPCDDLGTPADVDTPADLRVAADRDRRRGVRQDRGMELTVIDNPDRHRYEARTPDGEVAGFVQYQRRPDRIVLVHTEVRPEFEGQGVASTLAAGTLDDVRAHGLAVVPQCPYIRAYIERHPAYADLLADGERPPAG
ncbi:putative MobA-like protein [Frankia canadensis]|uniref:Putative MobA-like protein n=1 Tax=Frankia canadensis TaxID=1836972 RepID=A0A2I2KL36_9ACTN|nr:GNAT family N-acetyltransferase [Frankia canadensis]SNQ46373.1 putative MobA-like protein [Frankia canadensis]SOU53663.1 putative MobA-like protein [Frankia canadensis]